MYLYKSLCSIRALSADGLHLAVGHLLQGLAVFTLDEAYDVERSRQDQT